MKQQLVWQHMSEAPKDREIIVCIKPWWSDSKTIRLDVVEWDIIPLPTYDSEWVGYEWCSTNKSQHYNSSDFIGWIEKPAILKAKRKIKGNQPQVKQTTKPTNRHENTISEQLDAILLKLGETQERMIDAERQRDKLVEALDRIAHPLWWMQEDQKKATGSTTGMNGAMALSLSQDADYLKLIATEALQLVKKPTNQQINKSTK